MIEVQIRVSVYNEVIDKILEMAEIFVNIQELELDE